MRVRAFNVEDSKAWDDFCQYSFQATLLHTRLFLSYHGDRFIDRSLIIEKDGKWLGLFPAAPSNTNPLHIVSHPGATYGGVLHKGQLQGASMITALELIIRYYAKEGYSRLIYKAVPFFYHRVPAQDDLYALFRLGARRFRCDISSTIDSDNRQPISQRRKRAVNKAMKHGVKIAEGSRYIPDMWRVLTHNLQGKHGVAPIHSLTEITVLSDRFPKNIRCVCGVIDGEVVAGILLFITPTTSHAQYIASSQSGYKACALDVIFTHCVEINQHEGRRWFDFGISTENDGLLLNDGLYAFKAEFGAGSTIHEFFEMDLEK